MKLPSHIKIGRVLWEVRHNVDELPARGRYGETIPDPPRMNINVGSNPAAGETLFHEICHAVEFMCGLDYFKNSDDGHVAYLCMLYTTLRENNLLSSTIYCFDKIECAGRRNKDGKETGKSKKSHAGVQGRQAKKQ